jgi:hypothetical protein
MTRYFPVLVENTYSEHYGKWAVGSGTKRVKFYITTVCDTEHEAKKQCVLWTLQDLQRKMDDLYNDAVVEGLLDDVGLGEYLC